VKDYIDGGRKVNATNEVSWSNDLIYKF
jgi:hypothetical protein